MTPLDRRHFDFFAQWVGRPTRSAWRRCPATWPHWKWCSSDQRLFGGLRDVGSPGEVMAGPGTIWDRFRNVLVGYVGSYGPPGLLGFLDAHDPRRRRTPTAMRPACWACGGGSSITSRVYSFQPDVLAAVTPQFHWQEEPRPGQAWLHVGDVSQARVTPALNRWAYTRTRETALGNMRLMHALQQQLHVPAADCKAAAESLLAAKLICPLGGKYVFRPAPDGPGRWTSTALEAEAAGGPTGQPPPGYVARPLTWFRGLDLDGDHDRQARSRPTPRSLCSCPRKSSVATG